MNRPYHLRQADAGADFTGGSLSFAIVVVLVVKGICLKSSLINSVPPAGERLRSFYWFRGTNSGVRFLFSNREQYL